MASARTVVPMRTVSPEINPSGVNLPHIGTSKARIEPGRVVSVVYDAEVNHGSVLHGEDGGEALCGAELNDPRSYSDRYAKVHELLCLHCYDIMLSDYAA